MYPMFSDGEENCPNIGTEPRICVVKGLDIYTIRAQVLYAFYVGENFMHVRCEHII